MPELETMQEEQQGFMGLLDFIEDEEIEELGLEELQKEGFRIETREQAEYFVRKIKEWQEEEKAIKAYAKDYKEKQKEKIERWEESKINEFSFQMNRYMSMLEEYAKSELEGSKKKNVKLVEGTLQFRAAQPKYEYGDELLSHLKSERDNILVSLDDLNTVAIQDEEHGKVIPVSVLAAYVKDANQAVFISESESVNKAALKKEGTEKKGKLVIDNEPVPYITITHQEDSFSIK